mgnify:CR=1 FL=1
MGCVAGGLKGGCVAGSVRVGCVAGELKGEPFNADILFFCIICVRSDLLLL